MNYQDYITVFNTGDDETLVERFFTDDCVMTGGNREYHGKDELKSFLAWAHDGVREVMRPQNILQGRKLIFVEVDMGRGKGDATLFTLLLIKCCAE